MYLAPALLGVVMVLLCTAEGAAEGWRLEQHVIDNTIEEGDGLSLADVDGDGANNPIVGTGDGGQVYWYAKQGPQDWTRHRIAEGYTEIEGTVAADFNGDGQIEVIIFDQATQSPPGLVALAKQDTSDPKGSWSTLILDDTANHTQEGLVHDVSGDGRPDFIYSVEGSGADDGGFYWMQNLGGNPMAADNWVKHTIDQVSGAWWIDNNSPKNFNGNGNSGDILASVREGRNRANADGRIVIYHRPDNPINAPWPKTIVADLAGHDVLHVNSADFTGNGDDRDVAVGIGSNRGGAESNRGLHIYAFGTWQRTTLASHHYAAVHGQDINGDGRPEIIAMDRTDRELQLWVYSDRTGRYEIAARHDFIKADDQLIFDDIDGDGHRHEFFVGSDPRGLFWFKVHQPD